MKKKVLIGVVVIILGLIVVSAIGGSKDKTTQTTTKTEVNTETQATPKPEKITARELADDFDGNQVAAEAKWKDKLVEFSAQISNITDTGLSFTDIASKQFSMSQISCKIQDKQQLLPLKNGQTVTVKGTVGSQTIGVIDLKNCEVVK